LAAGVLLPTKKDDARSIRHWRDKMPSKIYAISNPSAAIALRYGKNVSRGIGMMEKGIVARDELIEEQKEKIFSLRKALHRASHDCEV
jgi:hypothetical protein